MALKDVYANTPGTDFAINFFWNAGANPSVGLLAAPFFTTPQPIEILTDRRCEVNLIVRFSPATTPAALKAAFENPLVKVRYFTDIKFHTKLYIVDDAALVGSANLTKNGLYANRELAILLRQDRDEMFYALPGIFDDLWQDAHVLTDRVLREYTKAYSAKDKPENEGAFEKFIHQTIAPAAPKSVVVGSDKVTKERTFIQRFRRKYDEVLIPAHDEILEVALKSGFGRPEYQGQDPQIEMGRFLGWLRLVHGSGDDWRETPLLKSKEERANRIAQHVDYWQSTDDTVRTDMYAADKEIQNIDNIRKYLCDSEELGRIGFDDLFDYLTGCHAFLERLRFVSKDLDGDSGLERLRTDFHKSNSRKDVVRTVDYLLSGPGDAIERAYDCVYGKYKLNGFGEACVMELLGWGDPKRPPFNNRSIRGIRFLGFDVEHLVAGG